jgi:hypothetical protein
LKNPLSDAGLKNESIMYFFLFFIEEEYNKGEPQKEV